MIVGFSKYGQGDARAAMDYFLSDRSVQPEVIHGDPDLLIETVSLIGNDWAYSSGVLSFAPGDHPNKEHEDQLISEFEEVAFSGIDFENRPQGVWVRHLEKGRHEMHFIYPRQLNDGRAYNMRPPNDEVRWDAFRTIQNAKYDWADPDDPDNARSISLPPAHTVDFLKKKNENRAEIERWISFQIKIGKIKCRDDLIEAFKTQGFGIPRRGKTYLTIQNVAGTRLRLKGQLFSENFTSLENIHIDQEAAAAAFAAERQERLKAAQEKLDRLTAKRAEFNRNRFKPVSEKVDPDLFKPLNELLNFPQKQRRSRLLVFIPVNQKQAFKGQLLEKQYKDISFNMNLLLYVNVDKNQVKLDDGSLVEDKGSKLSSEVPTEDSIVLMAEMAKSKGWPKVRISSDDPDHVKMAIHALMSRGISVSDPTPDMQNIIDDVRTQEKKKEKLATPRL